MKQLPALTLLLNVMLLTGGCNNVPQPPRSTSSQREPDDDAYNRTSQTESHHRHHHGPRDEASEDKWDIDDRSEPGNETSDGRGTSTYPPRGSERRSTRRRGKGRGLSAAPGQFDFYLLNLSWSPEFCHGHPGAPECAQHRAFTLHGLWPQNNDGTYPEHCSEAPGPTSPSQYADIYPDPALLQHEWQTHGTCSGLVPDQYLALARRADQTIRIPNELLTLTQSITLTPAQLRALIKGSNPAIPASSLAVSCGNNYLTAIEICLDKTLQPASCSAVKTCGATQIRIPAPQ